MDLLLRTTVLYWFLFLVMRGTGKRSIAELTPLDMLVLIVLGDIVQQGINQDDVSITGAVMAVSMVTAWTLVGDWATRRWPAAQRVLASGPIVIVRDGRIIDRHIRSERLTKEDVLAAARSNGHTDLGDIWVGVLEEDGTISFLKKQDA